jgi:hypothetical protein
MGRIIGIDKIGTLSHNAGAISLGPSLLTIGGQQHRILSNITRTIATDVTMAANTRYQIYAIVSGGVVALRISANENSVGPAGFISWKLVGSFYANGAASFGSFVNIEGMPSTNWLSYTPSVLDGTTDRSSEFSALIGKYRRSGDSISISFRVQRNVSASIGTGGSWNITGPSNLTFDWIAGTNARDGHVAKSDNTETFTLQSELPRYMWVIDNVAQTPLVYNNTNAAPSVVIAGLHAVGILGWSNTPIKDL